jgi:hypothetical protein
MHLDTVCWAEALLMQCAYMWHSMHAVGHLTHFTFSNVVPSFQVEQKTESLESLRSKFQSTQEEGRSMSAKAETLDK